MVRLIVKPIEWIDEGPKLRWLDTRQLPWKETYVETNDYRRVVEAIRNMEIRGAPAIGVAAAYALALAAFNIKAKNVNEFLKELERAKNYIASARPTAVNLFWALNRVYKRALEAVQKTSSIDEIRYIIVSEAKRIHEEDLEANVRLAKIGSKIIVDGDTILTHCNAGALATSGYGTALGIIRAAVEEGKNVKVIATETRPLLQGARLTVWELMKEGIDVTLITDNMVGYVMSRGLVDKVIVGADRITRDGYVANKIGTYGIAVIAYRHHVPFYVAAPSSSFDLSLEGPSIPIEERDPDEVRTILGKVLITLRDVKVLNPAFDITPPELITAIITDKGIITPPYKQTIPKVIGKP